MGRPVLPHLALLACVAAGAAALTAAAGDPGVSGTVIRVIDGDGLKVQLASGPITVRLFGIDAPELRQAGGKESRAALSRRVDGRQVWLDVRSQDDYHRMIATVWLGDEDINGWLVDQGHAWAFRRYLDDPDYCRREHRARRAGRGLWSPAAKDLYAPWEYRNLRIDQVDRVADYRTETAEHCIAAMQPGGAPPFASPSPSPTESTPCLIKGNIGRSGKIYHLPGSASYASTRIDESHGERWFCTTRDAVDAGWRAPH